MECVECCNEAETHCNYCGVDLCYDCVPDHEWNCPDAEE